MDPREAAMTIFKESGISVNELYRRAGTLTRFMYHGGKPQADTLVKIADACDYDLILRRRADGREIIIDEP